VEGKLIVSTGRSKVDCSSILGSWILHHRETGIDLDDGIGPEVGNTGGGNKSGKTRQSHRAWLSEEILPKQPLAEE
jgi:hypothetical protein